MSFFYDSIQQVVGIAETVGTVIADTPRGGVVTQCLVAREDAVGEGGDRLHAVQDFLTVVVVAGALPFRHPVAGIRQPVGTDAQSGGCGTRILAARLSQPHGVEVPQQGVGIALGVHEVAHALVARQIIVIT